MQLPEVVDHIGYQRVVENAGATWDYFPGHFDPEYAKKQGNPTIYVNTMHLAGFADRVATDWAGPGSRVVRRSMRLAASIYAGDTMIGRGRAVAKRRDTSVDPPRCLVDIRRFRTASAGSARRSRAEFYAAYPDSDRRHPAGPPGPRPPGERRNR